MGVPKMDILENPTQVDDFGGTPIDGTTHRTLVIFVNQSRSIGWGTPTDHCRICRR